MTPDPEPSGSSSPARAVIGFADQTRIETSRRARASPATDAMTTPSRVERFWLLRELGAGGMGAVFLAYDQKLDRRVAIKLIREDRIATPAAQLRMIREARALARLSHPNVVQVYDVGDYEDSVYVAMEYIAGSSLADVLAARADRERPLEHGDFIELFLQAGRGLAAAHAAGLVHRDFKPANVLVGEDGRARVVDFGLVTASLGLPLSDDGERVAQTDDVLHAELTAAGTVLGTPAFMAPEQFLAQTIDARSDQFSFCVALYRALVGTPPFPGDTFAEIRANVIAGKLREPGDHGAPSWVLPIITRGLAIDPRDRYPSMDALLDALARDPVALWRQRRRTVGLVLGTALLVVASVYGGRAAWAAWQRSELELRAADHLARVEDEMARLRGEGQVDQAEQAFEDFSALVEYQGTTALTRAWIHRAGAQARALELDAAASSYARAYTSAADPTLANEALLGIAGIMVKRHRWSTAERAVEALDGRAPLPRGDAAALAVDIALAQLEFGRAATLAARGPEDLRWLAPVAENMSHMTSTSYINSSGHVRRLYAPDRLWIAGDDPTVARLDERLTSIGSAPRAKHLASARYRPGDGQYLVGMRQLGASFVDTLYRSTRDGIEPLEVLDKQLTYAIEAADLDRDGRDELYLGGRPLTAARQHEDGSWTMWEPYPEGARLRCSVMGLLADDLDGDGREELLAACGAWDAYDVRVYAHDDASSRLRLRARRMLGHVENLATMRRPDGARVLVAPKLEQYANSVVFPAERSFGGPPGVYLLRLEGDELTLDARIELPRDARGRPPKCSNPLVADVDGDGLDDLVLFTWASATDSYPRNYTYLLRQRADGSFSTHAIAHVLVHAITNLDEDPALEWIVTDQEHDQRIWILGVGDDPAPGDATRLVDPGATAWPSAPPADDPVFARLWERATVLDELGLELEAAETLERLAALSTTPALQRAAWRQAASEHARRRADGVAARLFERAAAVDDDPATWLEAARSYRRAGEQREALRVLERPSLADDPAAADEVDAFRRRLRSLITQRALELDFERGLPPGLVIEVPQALELVPERHVLRVRSPRGRVLMSYPVRWDGRELVMTSDLELARGEYGSHFEIALRRAGEDSYPSFSVGAWGGAGAAKYSISTRFGEEYINGYLSERNGRWRLRMRLSYFADEGFGRLELIDVDTGERVLNSRVTEREGLGAFTPGRYQVELRSEPGYGGVVDVELARLELLGVTREPAAASERAVARQLVAGRPGAALRELGPARAEDPPETQALRLMALARLGRHDEAARVAEVLLATSGGEARVRELLRLAPAEYLAILRSAAGERAFALLYDVWFDAHQDNAGVVGHARALLPALTDVDSIEDDATRGGLLEIRGDLRMSEGQFEGARADLEEVHRLRARASTLHVGLVIKLAALAAARGDEAGALRYARSALEMSWTPEITVARLRARPELGALQGQPDWEQLLGPDDRLLYDDR